MNLTQSSVAMNAALAEANARIRSASIQRNKALDEVCIVTGKLELAERQIQALREEIAQLKDGGPDDG